MKPARQLHPKPHRESAKVVTHPDHPRKNPSQELLMDRDYLGRMRRELIWTVGRERCHGVMARWGQGCGLSETVRSPTQRPLIQGLGDWIAIEAEARAQGVIIEVPNSLEASEHLRYFQENLDQPECWFLAGYMTGRMSGQSGHATYVLETQCVAKGDPVCRFVGRSREEWLRQPEMAVKIQIYEEDNFVLELDQTKEQLDLTKNRYQNLFEQTSTPMVILDPQTGYCFDANKAAENITGYSRNDLTRMTIFDLRPATEHQATMNRLKLLLNKETVVDRESVLLRKDGTERIVMVSSKAIDYGGRSMILSLFRDITDLKFAEQKERDLQNQLSRSERLSTIGRLAASVAHEIKNPLGAIRNAIYYIKGAVLNTPAAENDPEVKKILILAEEEVDGAVRTIEDLLDFSRVVSLIPRRTNMNELLEKISIFVPFPDKVELVWDLDVTLPVATVDPDRLMQVFTNITNNAIQAMPNGGTLTIRTRLEVETSTDKPTQSEWVLVAFEDTGGGIFPQHIKKIFEPLFTTKARGTGLGLAITNNIVEKHGGVIMVTSQLGKGSCFTVKLPLHSNSMTEEPTNGHQEDSSR